MTLTVANFLLPALAHELQPYRSSMDVTSILQEGRCVEQVYRHDDDLLERCRTDEKLLLNGLDATQFGVLVHLRNVVGEELGFIRVAFKHGNSRDAVAIDVMQLFAMFASTIIQHVADGPYNQLALPVSCHASWVSMPALRTPLL